MKKYEFSKSEVNHLGHIMGLGKFWVDQEIVQSMKGWPDPTSIKELQQFLGFAN